MARSKTRVSPIAGLALIAALLSLVVVAAPSAAVAAGASSSGLAWAVTDAKTGTTFTAQFTLVPLRGPDFRVRVQGAGGVLTDVTAQVPEDASYLGTVDGHPDAAAAATVWADGTVHGEIIFDRGATWFFTEHAVSKRRGMDPPASYPWPLRRSMDTDLIGSDTLTTEVAYDVDSAQYALGGNVAPVLDTVRNTLNNERLIYLQDVGISQTLGDVVIRADAASDPYAPLAATTNAYLGAVRNEWTTTLSPYPDDQVQVVSPRISGGLAYESSYQKAWNFGAYGGGPDDWSAVSRHENGHNWGPLDENGGDPEGPTVMSGNAYARFDSTELYAIANSRSTRKPALTNTGTYQTTHIPPYAGMDLLQVVAGSTAAPLSPLVNDHSANGSALHLVSADVTSALGATIAVDTGDRIDYLPLAASTDAIDHFSYTVADANGYTATGLVLVKNTAPFTVVEAESAQPTGAAIVTDGSDHSGTGYVAFAAGKAQSLEWTIPSDTEHDVTLEFQTKNTAAGSADISVDNIAAGTLAVNPAVPGPENEGTIWGPSGITAHLKAGTNTIRLTSSSLDPVDFLRITDNPAAATTGATPALAALTGDGHAPDDDPSVGTADSGVRADTAAPASGSSASSAAHAGSLASTGQTVYASLLTGLAIAILLAGIALRRKWSKDRPLARHLRTDSNCDGNTRRWRTQR